MQRDEQLIADAKGLFDSIYVVECYGSKDLMRLDATIGELERRGYTVVERTTLDFIKEED